LPSVSENAYSPGAMLINQSSELGERCRRYWGEASPTIDGVLGGLAHVHELDIRGSMAFLDSLKSVGRDRALDCGSGIGRIAKHLLCPLFRTTDVMEPTPHLLERAKVELRAAPVGEFLQESMQTASFPHRYDVISIQWVAAYVNDRDLISFLSRAKSALNTSGIIFLKDNVVDGTGLVVHDEDGSQTRSKKRYAEIFAQAGLKCAKQRLQRQWPSDLFQAKMYALR
jgi:protein N-terminal methyltransferase